MLEKTDTSVCSVKRDISHVFCLLFISFFCPSYIVIYCHISKWYSTLLPDFLIVIAGLTLVIVVIIISTLLLT